MLMLALLFMVNHYVISAEQSIADGIQVAQSWVQECVPSGTNRYCCLKKALPYYIWALAHGTSISHLHDHLCGADNDLGGRLVAVDLAPRCLRDLTHLAKTRPGLVPVLGDARKHSAWGVLLPRKVNWLFQDVAQSGQVEIFIKACQRFLNVGGVGLLSLKVASERWTGEGEDVLFGKVEEQLVENGFAVEESIKLTGYEDNHVLFVTRRVEYSCPSYQRLKPSRPAYPKRGLARRYRR